MKYYQNIDLHGKHEEFKEHCKTLGIQENATLQEAQQAYKKIALLNHPDKTLGRTKKDIAKSTKIFLDAKNAIDALNENWRVFQQTKAVELANAKQPKASAKTGIFTAYKRPSAQHFNQTTHLKKEFSAGLEKQRRMHADILLNSLDEKILMVQSLHAKLRIGYSSRYPGALASCMAEIVTAKRSVEQGESLTTEQIKTMLQKFDYARVQLKKSPLPPPSSQTQYNLLEQMIEKTNTFLKQFSNEQIFQSAKPKKH